MFAFPVERSRRAGRFSRQVGRSSRDGLAASLARPSLSARAWPRAAQRKRRRVAARGVRVDACIPLEKQETGSSPVATEGRAARSAIQNPRCQKRLCRNGTTAGSSALGGVWGRSGREGGATKHMKSLWVLRSCALRGKLEIAGGCFSRMRVSWYGSVCVRVRVSGWRGGAAKHIKSLWVSKG